MNLLLLVLVLCPPPPLICRWCDGFSSSAAGLLTASGRGIGGHASSAIHSLTLCDCCDRDRTRPDQKKKTFRWLSAAGLMDGMERGQGRWRLWWCWCWWWRQKWLFRVKEKKIILYFHLTVLLRLALFSFSFSFFFCWCYIQFFQFFIGNFSFSILQHTFGEIYLFWYPISLSLLNVGIHTNTNTEYGMWIENDGSDSAAIPSYAHSPDDGMWSSPHDLIHPPITFMFYWNWFVRKFSSFADPPAVPPMLGMAGERTFSIELAEYLMWLTGQGRGSPFLKRTHVHKVEEN